VTTQRSTAHAKWRHVTWLSALSQDLAQQGVSEADIATALEGVFGPRGEVMLRPRPGQELSEEEEGAKGCRPTPCCQVTALQGRVWAGRGIRLSFTSGACVLLCPQPHATHCYTARGAMWSATEWRPRPSRPLRRRGGARRRRRRTRSALPSCEHILHTRTRHVLAACCAIVRTTRVGPGA
jgi:hypothetical protein